MFFSEEYASLGCYTVLQFCLDFLDCVYIVRVWEIRFGFPWKPLPNVLGHEVKFLSLKEKSDLFAVPKAQNSIVSLELIIVYDRLKALCLTFSSKRVKNSWQVYFFEDAL